MEDRVESPEILKTSEKSRSLDLQIASAEKSVAPNGARESRVLKRKSCPTKKNQESSFERVKRRKGRKEVSLSSFEDATKKSRGNLDSRSPDSNNSGLKLNGFPLFEKSPVEKKRNKDETAFREQNLQSLSNLNDISHPLDDNVIVIPKRPRGFSGPKKFQGNYVGKHTVNSVSRRVNSRQATLSSKNGAEFSKSKLIVDSGKRKRILDKLKGNSSGGTTSAPKRARRNRQKIQKYEGEKHTQGVKRPLVENSVNFLENLQEDDEENLEQNAARMLSSRFDPSCTGFSGRGAALKSQSADGLSFSPLFDGEFKSLGEDALVGSENAGRVLRPRNQRKQKGLVKRQRRHFYEVCYMDMNPYRVVNQRIKVFWPLDQTWYFGIVKGYDPVHELHHVKYDDRDEEWINLQSERFKLLLLPDEVRGKSCPEKPGREGKRLDEDADANFVDENCTGNFMDSEPIISWLSRSTHRVKSSPLAFIKKQKQSRLLESFPQPTFSDNSAEMPSGWIDVGPSSSGTGKLFMSSVVPDRSVVREVAEKSLVESGACSSDRNMPLVYFRRRFRNRCQGLGNVLEKSACRSADGSVSLLASVIDRVGPMDEFDIALQYSSVKDLRLVEYNSLTALENLTSKLPVCSTKLEVRLKLSLPQLRVIDLAFGAESFWLYNMLLLFKYGTLTTVWPSVRVEMLFVDNIVGLRFMLFEGCLKQAVAFLCYIMEVFYRPKDHCLFEDFQLPVTSIRFKLLNLQDIGRQLEFIFYNFLELKSSKWLQLDNKLKHHCIVTKELPLAECTYANIKTLKSGSDKIHVSAVCEVPIPLEGLQKRSRRSIVCRNCSSCKFDGKLRRLPPLVLSFAAAPTFFLSLHLNLLIENNIASINLQNNDLMSLQKCPERFCKLIGDGCSLVGDSSDLDSKTTFENTRCCLSCDAAATGWLSSVNRKPEAVASSVGDGGDGIKSSQESLPGKLYASRTTVGCRGAGKSMSDKIVPGLEICPFHNEPSLAPDDLSFPEKSENGCISHFNGTNIQSSSFVDVEDQPVNQPTQVAKMSMNNLGARNMIDGMVCYPNPTAPRSMWHRSRQGSVSSSFCYRSKLWPDFIGNNGLVNDSRKPQSQVSYLLPFSGHNVGSKPRSHRRKGHPYKRIDDENVKVSDGSGSPRRYVEPLFCDANVLVTVGDRGWRECGAQVVLEYVDHKDWRLLVKISGVAKYSYKAHRFLQPGTTNRYTHAMMWKGGQDWSLEFPDRSQWVLFKEMHEECYNRNIRVASVKNIPIPGVRLVEDSDDCTVEVPFVRTQKYFRETRTDVEMAMDPSRVFYDMESDDEEWISKFKSSSDAKETNTPDITEEIFERVIGMFERVAYDQQCENFTSDEIEHFMAGIGPMDSIKAIYNYWQQKRLKKGMPLIRHLQPALWERYRQQLWEWELMMSGTQNSSDGCNEKVTLVEKPPMFAFCLRPRGLEVPNKGTKQRPQRKFTVLGHHGGVSRDSVNGRKVNGFYVGDEKTLVTDQSYVSSDVSPWLQTSTKLSPRDAAGLGGNLSTRGDWSGRNQYPKLQRNKLKKFGMHLSPRESPTASMPFNQRTGKRNICQWNIGSPECHSLKRYQLDGFQRNKGDQFGGPDFDEFRLRDASGAAQHAANMAKLKRERAHRLLLKADLAMHKAVVALTTAEAIRASEKESNADE